MSIQPDPLPPERRSLASTKADFRELRSNTSATVQELQEFLGQLRGKNPQEMLGIVATSQLIRSLVISLLLVTAALFAFTAIPYFFGDGNKEEVADTSPVPVVAPKPATTAPSTESDSRSTQPNNAENLKPLKVNETKTAPSNVNPLEDKSDDFLKDLE